MEGRRWTDPAPSPLDPLAPPCSRPPRRPAPPCLAGDREPPPFPPARAEQGGRRAQRAALPGGPRRPCRPPPRIAQPRRPSAAPALAQPQLSRPGQRSRSSPSLCTDRAVAQEFRKRSECEDPFDYVGSSSSWTRSSSKRDLSCRSR